MSALELTALGLAAQARAMAATVAAQQRRVRIVSSHGGFAVQPVAQSNGTATGGTDRLAFVLNTDARALRFVLGNGYTSQTQGLNRNGNAVQFCAVFEAPNVVFPIAFPATTGAKIQQADGSYAPNALTASVIGDSQIAESLPMTYGAFAKGSTQYYRVHKKVAAGERWSFTTGNQRYNWTPPGSYVTTDPVYGTSDRTGNDSASNSGPAGWGSYASTAYAFGFHAIVGEQTTPLPVVLIAGDSISDGQGDTAFGRGYMVRACEAAQVGYHVNGMPGTRLSDIARGHPGAAFLAQYADHVWIHGGTNDLALGGAGFAATQANFIAVARNFAAAGAKLWFSTILPRINSTDSWATYANQIPYAYDGTRVQLNNWLRDPRAGGAVDQIGAAIGRERVGGILDVCPPVERNADGSALVLDVAGQQVAGTGGRWIVNGSAGYATMDGTHPSPAGTALIAAGVPVAQRFTL